MHSQSGSFKTHVLAAALKTAFSHAPPISGEQTWMAAEEWNDFA
jgi:hypothetical protein